MCHSHSATPSSRCRRRWTPPGRRNTAAYTLWTLAQPPRATRYAGPRGSSTISSRNLTLSTGFDVFELRRQRAPAPIAQKHQFGVWPSLSCTRNSTSRWLAGGNTPETWIEQPISYWHNVQTHNGPLSSGNRRLATRNPDCRDRSRRNMAPTGGRRWAVPAESNMRLWRVSGLLTPISHE